ncbi:MAG: DNA polymerase I [Symbiobacteriia bacterium]
MNTSIEVVLLPSGKLMLIDGNSLANRAFYALPPLTTARGQMTNAVVGFLNMLFRLLEQERPEYVAVAFDRSAPTFRHQEYADYKAQRTGMPEDLRAQMPVLKEVLSTLGLRLVELEGYEADDVIGTLSRLGEEEGLTVLVVTGDRDALQLLSSKVRVLLTRKGISEVQTMDPPALQAEYGLEPHQIIDLKGLMGDASDNIPGLPGVGEKTALKLLLQFGNVEAVLAGADQIAGKKLQETVRTHADLARLSKRLATIDRQAPVAVTVAEMRLAGPDREQAAALFRDLELHALARRLDTVFGGAAAGGGADSAVQTEGAGDGSTARDDGPATQDAGPFWDSLHVTECDSPAAFAAAVEPLLAAQPAWVLRPMGAAWILAAAGEGQAVTLALPGQKGEPRPGWDAVAALAAAVGDQGEAAATPGLAAYWTDPEVPKRGHDIKPLVFTLRRAGLKARGLAFDTALAAYLLDANRSQYRVVNLAVERGLAPLLTEAEAPSPAAFAAAEAALAWRLAPPMAVELEAAGLAPLMRDLEMPLLGVLTELETAGVRVDREALAAMGVELEQRIGDLTGAICELAGETFNINSTRQLGEILFDKLGLPAVKKTKTGYSTDAGVLEELEDRHPIVAKILEHRTLVKLKGTYVDGLSGLIDPVTGRVHTTFNQTVAATGRLSSTDPNLQNIPIRLEEGRRLRKVFVASPGNLLFAADYSQIELRILAHIAGDEALVDAFWHGQDIHRRTAAEVFGVSMDDVTREMRAAAKAVNFGLAYGQTDFGLARSLGIPRAEAKAYIDSYFGRYPGVKAYMERAIEEARQHGYATTLLGRRRPLPDINSRNRNLRQYAERTAINTPIQGTAADIIKVAMIDVQRALEAAGLQARMLLQVHDELVLEVPEGELFQVRELVVSNMERAMKLNVPLGADPKLGRNWYDMQPV